MTQLIMIAIVIPYYKKSFFELTLSSLSNQTDKRFNVYIGDDASPNPPDRLLEKYIKKLDMTYSRFENNLGGKSLVKQWDRCLGLVQDEPWLMMLCDDDTLENNVVEKFYMHLKEINDLNLNVVRFSTQNIDSDSNKISKIYEHPKLELASDAYYKHFQGEYRSSLSEYIFRKNSYVKRRFTHYPLGWHSDDKAWLDFSEKGFIYSINDTTVNIRLSNENISGKKDNLIQKLTARRLFLKDILFNNYKFKNKHKSQLLLEYGVLIKKQNQINIKEVLSVFIEFVKIAQFYDCMRFLRRMYRAKFLNLNK